MALEVRTCVVISIQKVFVTLVYIILWRKVDTYRKKYEAQNPRECWEMAGESGITFVGCWLG